MKEIVVKTQAELDALPSLFSEYTYIYIQSEKGNWISVSKAWENSSVEARENSSVVAWENSSVVARENSSVEAWENSSVVARGNSSVVAWGNVGVHVFSIDCHVTLFMFAVCWLIAKAKVKKESKTAKIIIPKTKSGLSGWMEGNAVKPSSEVILFKRVSSDFKTQEGNPNETLWAIGTTLTHPKWNPKSGECGEGKFHACSRPYFCNEFRSKKGDKYIAVEIKRVDLYAWPNPGYPHKIGFRAGRVLYECNKFGKKI